MGKEILIATNNPGKKFEISRHLNHYGIEVVTPSELGIDIDIPETGSSLEENATLKVVGYAKLVSDMLIIGDDTGLEIDALNGEPGIHVRRWRDGRTRMTDEEIIEYCLEKMRGIPPEKRGAQFRSVLALKVPGQEGVETFDGILRGTILEQAIPIRVEGFSFESLFFVPEWKMLLLDARYLDPSEKESLLNHREKAIENAIPRIRELLK